MSSSADEPWLVSAPDTCKLNIVGSSRMNAQYSALAWTLPLTFSRFRLTGRKFQGGDAHPELLQSPQVMPYFLAALSLLQDFVGKLNIFQLLRRS